MEDQSSQAYEEAALEIGKSIAIGAVPFIGQAIDLYDTIESIWNVVRSDKASQDERDTAKLDLLLAIIGWIPGPGDGIKKSFRLVNRHPERYGPVFFDLLRRVCSIAGIQTSPEALLDKIFNVGQISAQLTEVRSSVESSSAYKSLPVPAQQALAMVLMTTATQVPELVGIAARKITKIKTQQHNSSANAATSGTRAQQKAVEPKDAQTASKGQDRPATAAPGQVLSTKVQEKAFDLTNTLKGVAGEHIADYFCAEKLHWAPGWVGHDKGGVGKWNAGVPHKQPGADVPGKVSNGGSPRTPGTLFKLSDGANDSGIDSVWRVSSHNDGKPFAIMEAKTDEPPSVHGYFKGTRKKKPAVKSKLGINGQRKLDELLAEDAEREIQKILNANENATAPARKRGAGRGKQTAPQSQRTKQKKITLMVQMSHLWIEKNLVSAVGFTLDDEIQRRGYSRHVAYIPLIPSVTASNIHAVLASGFEHGVAIGTGAAAQEEKHRNHDVVHYHDHGGKNEVHDSVVAVQNYLKKKYANVSIADLSQLGGT